MASHYGDNNSLASGGGRRSRKPNLIADKASGLHPNKNTTSSRLNRSNEGDNLSVASDRIGGNDDSSVGGASRRRADHTRQQNYLSETVTSVARKATTEEFLQQRHHQDSYGFRSDVSVISGDFSTRGGGASVATAATGTSHISRKKPTMTSGKIVGAAPDTASRRYTSSASVYSETRKQKLVLDQSMNAAVKAGVDRDGSISPDRDRDGGVPSTSRKKKKKKQPNWYHRDPDSCVKVSIRVYPEPEDVPKCIEIRKIAHSSWDDDDESEIDDDAFVYNGIRIFDPNHDGSEETKEHEFNFDNIFEPTSAHDEIYAKAVAPLVESSCCQGFNSTVLAYGETATGKTYTLLGHAHHNPKNAASAKPGSPKGERTKPAVPPKAVSSSISCASSVASSLASFTTFGDASVGAGGRLLPEVAIIPRALYSVFRLLESMKQALTSETSDFDFVVRVQFLELYDNEIWDLLSDPSNSKMSKGPGGRNAKGNKNFNTKVTLRWSGPDPPYIIGATQPIVKSAEEAWHYVRQGRKRRHTAKTDKNATSSRSHAIFSVLITQTTTVKAAPTANSTTCTGSGQGMICEDGMIAGQETRTKLNFVDLAAPQRNTSDMKAADPARFKEQCDINQSLLTLRLVIRAVVEQQEHDKETHNKKGTVAPKRVPYRDSKLTSVLQGSIGGDHKLVMIACISPAAKNVDHSLECLKYMDKIQHIENKPSPNVDHFSHASFYSREQMHRQQKDDASAQSIPSCSSTIVTRQTYGSGKQNYETPLRHPILGLVHTPASDVGQRLTMPSPSRLSSPVSSPVVTPDRQRSSNIASSDSSRTDRRYLSDDDSQKGDEWDATLDDLLCNDSFDTINRPQQLVVVTPAPETTKKRATKEEFPTPSTVDETPMKEEYSIGQTETPRLRGVSHIAASAIVTPYVNAYDTPQNQKRTQSVEFSYDSIKHSTPSTETLTPTTYERDDLNAFGVSNESLDYKFLSEPSEHSKDSDLVGMKHLPDSYDLTYSPPQREMVTASELDDKLKELSATSANILSMKAPLTNRQVWPNVISPSPSKVKTPARSNTSSTSIEASRKIDLNKPLKPLSPKRTPPSPVARYSSTLVNESHSTTSSAVSYLFADDNSSLRSESGHLKKLDSSLDIGDNESYIMAKSVKMSSERQALKVDLDDDDYLFSYIGRLLLLKSEPTEMLVLHDLKCAIKEVFDKRNQQDTATNKKSIRNAIHDASETDDAVLRKLLEIDNDLPDSSDYEIQRLIGFWVCHNQSGHDKTDGKGNQIVPLIGTILSTQSTALNPNDVKDQIKFLLSKQSTENEGIDDQKLQSTLSVSFVSSGNNPDVVRSIATGTKSIYNESDVQDLIGHWILRKRREKDNASKLSGVFSSNPAKDVARDGDETQISVGTCVAVDDPLLTTPVVAPELYSTLDSHTSNKTDQDVCCNESNVNVMSEITPFYTIDPEISAQPRIHENNDFPCEARKGGLWRESITDDVQSQIMKPRLEVAVADVDENDSPSLVIAVQKTSIAGSRDLHEEVAADSMVVIQQVTSGVQQLESEDYTTSGPFPVNNEIGQLFVSNSISSAQGISSVSNEELPKDSAKNSRIVAADSLSDVAILCTATENIPKESRKEFQQDSKPNGQNPIMQVMHDGNPCTTSGTNILCEQRTKETNEDRQEYLTVSNLRLLAQEQVDDSNTANSYLRDELLDSTSAEITRDGIQVMAQKSPDNHSNAPGSLAHASDAHVQVNISQDEDTGYTTVVQDRDGEFCLQQVYKQDALMTKDNAVMSIPAENGFLYPSSAELNLTHTPLSGRKTSVVAVEASSHHLEDDDYNNVQDSGNLEEAVENKSDSSSSPDTITRQVVTFAPEDSMGSISVDRIGVTSILDNRAINEVYSCNNSDDILSVAESDDVSLCNDVAVVTKDSALAREVEPNIDIIQSNSIKLVAESSDSCARTSYQFIAEIGEALNQANEGESNIAANCFVSDGFGTDEFFLERMAVVAATKIIAQEDESSIDDIALNDIKSLAESNVSSRSIADVNKVLKLDEKSNVEDIQSDGIVSVVDADDFGSTRSYRSNFDLPCSETNHGVDVKALNQGGNAIIKDVNWKGASPGFDKIAEETNRLPLTRVTHSADDVAADILVAPTFVESASLPLEASLECSSRKSSLGSKDDDGVADIGQNTSAFVNSSSLTSKLDNASSPEKTDSSSKATVRTNSSCPTGGVVTALGAAIPSVDQTIKLVKEDERTKKFTFVESASLPIEVKLECSSRKSSLGSKDDDGVADIVQHNTSAFVNSSNLASKSENASSPEKTSSSSKTTERTNSSCPTGGAVTALGAAIPNVAQSIELVKEDDRTKTYNTRPGSSNSSAPVSFISTGECLPFLGEPLEPIGDIVVGELSSCDHTSNNEHLALSESLEIDEMLNEFDKILEETDSSVNRVLEDIDTSDRVMREIVLNQGLGDESSSHMAACPIIPMIGKMSNEKTGEDGPLVDDTNVLLYKEGAPYEATISNQQLPRPELKEMIVASSIPEACEVAHENDMTRIEIERERQRQEEYAEAIARTCCSVSCLGRTIEAYYYDYGFQSEPGEQNNSDPQRVVTKKRRSWISRVMGLGDSAVTKLPPPPSAGILPEEGRRGNAKRRNSSTWEHGAH